MKEKTCCFSGHREILPDKMKQLQKQLEKAIRKLIDRDVIYFGAGGARGFDTLCALSVIKLRKRYPQIKLILVLPCKNQTYGWMESDSRLYWDVFKQADKVVFLSDSYYPGCMHNRNRHLVDHSGFCICYLKKQNGGTAYTVQYANQCGLEIIRLS